MRAPDTFRIYVSCGSQNKRHLFPYTTLTEWFLGAFAELQKVTISFVMSVRPSVRMEQLSYHWKDFHENDFFFEKICPETSNFLKI
jgi:hypothetical protein